MGYSTQFVGKHLLVGITYVDRDNNVLRQVQMHGKISRIDDNGIVLLQENGNEFTLPPDVASLKPAEPGSYRIRSTGEIVENTDFVSTWTCVASETSSDEVQ